MKDNKGQALVEFIMVLPLLLLIIMAIIDFGNIFIKKYSLENDLDIISEMYEKDDYKGINSYISDNNLSIEYENDYEFTKINISKKININTPILNNILGKEYVIETSRSIYE